MVAYTGGPMRIAGWRYPVVVDLAGMAIPSQNRPIRFGHDMQSGVGHTDAIEIEGGQLIAAGVVSRDTAAAKEIVVSARNGFPWQASIGAAVEEFEFIKENQRVMVNGREFAGPVNVVRKATLGEISFVDLGADGQTSAEVAAAATHLSQENTEMEDYCRNQSEHRHGPSDGHCLGNAAARPPRHPGRRGSSDGRWNPCGRCGRDQPCRGHPRDLRRPLSEDRGRGHPRGLGLPPVANWPCCARAARRPPAMQVRESNNAVSGSLLEAACMMTAKLDGVENLFDEPTLEAAQKRFRGGIGLQELLLEAAWANGYTGRNFREARDVLRFAFHPELEAGFSTVDIGGIL